MFATDFEVSMTGFRNAMLLMPLATEILLADAEVPRAVDATVQTAGSHATSTAVSMGHV
jgi:hypothetical protein